MEGATHVYNGEPVKATHWVKDGDHPLVVRYPIERREWKGLLRVKEPGSKKDVKYALRFGEWIIEDAKGRIYVVSAQELPEAYQPIGSSGAATVANVVAVLAAIAYVLLGNPGDGLLFLGFGVTHLMYYTSLLAQWNGSANIFDLDEAADDVKVSAHTNTYSINQDTHDFFDDLTNEVTGTNYTAGGAALASQSLTRSTNTVTFDAADTVWTQSGAGFSNARKFVVYRNSGSGATSRLFSVITADADVGNVTGDLTLQYNASGIATWTTT